MTKEDDGTQTISMPMLYAKLGPSLLNIAAKHCYRAKQEYKSPHEFSHLPYFLLSRSMELSIKARHLKRFDTMAGGLREVKERYGHSLMKAYNALFQDEKILNTEELKVFEIADDIYGNKGFEYVNPEHTLTGYAGFPDLKVLDEIAKKFLDNFSDS